jgi:2-iminobutanoate/2-iminopropanoate deaminase
MAGEDAAGKVPPNFEDEVRQAFANIGAVLKEAKMSSSDVVSVPAYLTDGTLFDRTNTVL